MKALYRKYRPTTLKDVVGQKQVTDVLESSLKKGKVSHAYLFTGPRGCGKTSVARIFAHEINGFKYELEDFYPDIIEIDAASNTGVENIRDLREKAIIAPSEGKYKVYIIDEVHMLSKSAFNALLKTLEEPPEHVVFIMATTDAYKVPITITSRSQTFKFELSTPDVMLSHLEKIAKAEKIDIEKEALEIIVRRGGGSFRDSISLLDQISTIKDGKITSKILEESLGLPKDTKISSLLDSYKSGNLAEISENLKTLLNENIKPELIAEEIIEHILENPTPETLPLLKTLVEVSFPFAEAKLLLAFTESLAVKPAAQVSIQTQIQAPIQAQAQAKPQVETKTEKAKSEESTKTKPETEPETEPEAEPEAEPEPEAKPKPDQPNAQPEETGFTWQSYLDSIRQASPSNAKILESCNYKISGTSIIVTTDRKIYKTILESANNIKVLKEKLPENYSLNILGPDDVISTEDPQISKLSAIMGGNIMEVKENAGDSPF